MNKKGDTELIMNVIYVVMAIMILAMFAVWISGLMTGSLSKAQIMSKETALIIDSAEPDTTISITHEPGSISIDSAKREVLAKIGKSEFVYDYFSKYRISCLNINDTYSVVRIEK